MRVKPILAWYDFWVGLFWDRSKRRLYVFPVPMVGLVVEFGRPGPAQVDEEGVLLAQHWAKVR